MNLKGLYKGNLDGQVMVTGSLLSPVIEGGVRLSNGQVFLPQGKDDSNPNLLTPVAQQWLTDIRPLNLVIFPRLKNFRVNLQNLYLSRNPLYEFHFGGDLILNGRLDNLNNIQPRGVITLQQGRISFLDTRFLLNRRRQNQLTFTPAQGLLNPDLDIEMRTILTSFPDSTLQRRTDQANEIPDDSLTRVQRIDVTLDVDGRLNELFPTFGKDVTQVCQILPGRPPISEEPTYTQEELQQLELCLQALVAQRRANKQLLSSRVVTFRSSPPRSEAEIVRLLGDQLFVIASALQTQNGQQLLDYGVVQLAFPLLLQGLAYDIENAVSNALSMTEFRALPFLEAVYRVDQESFVRFSYDYNFDEVTVRYERRF